MVTTVRRLYLLFVVILGHVTRVLRILLVGGVLRLVCARKVTWRDRLARSMDVLCGIMITVQVNFKEKIHIIFSRKLKQILFKKNVVKKFQTNSP